MTNGTTRRVNVGPDTLEYMQTSQGRTVAEASEEGTVLLVFLRHFGCTFCREALSDLAATRGEIAAAGANLLFVHMADNKTAEEYFRRFDLWPAEHVSDPPCRFYQAFGLAKGTPRQLFGLQSWIRGFEAGVVQGLGVGTQLGDGFQMPGAFVLSRSEIKGSFIHDLASDRPSYVDIVREYCEI